MSQTSLKYRRILLKLSGEALQGDGEFGVDYAVLEQIVREVSEARSCGVDIAIVIGGGNIFRGASLSKVGMDHATADYVGMLATIMNAMILQETFRSHGVDARAMSALNIEAVVEPYIRGKAIRYIESGTVVIFAGGTGNPFFTTDTAAALRATEMGADILLKATKVDGVYSKDPLCHSDAVFYRTVSFHEALEQDLKVMDATALALCRDQSMPISVFSLFRPGALLRVLRGEEEGTLVYCSSVRK